MTRFTQAGRAFEAFTGDPPRKVKATPLEDGNVVGWALGPAVGVAYEAVRDGEKAQYFHEFAKADRPTLVAREDGRKLFFAGGNYTVTAHGIEDMSKLFVVNPSPRRGLKRNPMATAKRNRSGQFVKGHRRAAAPKRRRRSHSRQVAIFTGNPAPHRKRRRHTTKRAYRRNPAGRRTYRRNPTRGGGLKGFTGMIVPAIGVGAGAVGTEMFMGYLPIPAAWKSGVMRQVTKGAVGLAAGWAIAHLLKQKKLGFYVMAGAVVIAVHDAIKEAITAKLPSNAGAFGQYVRPLHSQFAGVHHKGMGYINPAMVRPRFGQYVHPLRNQFAGAAPIMHHPGGETEFQA